MSVADKVEWDEFLNQFKWRQGEHVMAIAPTGAGKTTLLSKLMPLRKNNIMFGTKADDPMYREILRSGFKRIESFSEIKPWDRNILLWPKHTDVIRNTYAVQRNAFEDALNHIARQGGWTIWADEMKYMSEHLKLTPQLTFILEQLRSINGTIIGGAQRPKWLPLSALANASHVFLWKSQLSDDAKRLADIGGIDYRKVIEEMYSLGSHEFLYIRTRGTDARILRSQVRR